MNIKCYLSVFLCVCGHLVSAQPGADCTDIPSIPTHGHITYTPSLQSSHYAHGTRAEYICDAGYTNDGHQIVIYCNDGVWLGLKNDDPTKCVTESTDSNDKDCESPLGRPTDRPNMILTGSYRTGSTVTFMCVPGYYLHPNLDPPASHCINGGWTKEPPPYCIMYGDIPTTTSPPVGEEDSSPGSSTGVIVGVIVPILIILIIIAFITFRYYRSEERPLLPPPPIVIDAPWDFAHLRVIDSHEISYAAPHAVLTSNDVTFGTRVDDGFENTYNATICLEGDRQQNAVVRTVHGTFSTEDKEAMEREIEDVFNLPLHYSVLRPIAQIADEDMIGICTEKAPKGSLWSYLHSFRDARNSVKPKARELISYALQIAEGIKFLHEEERVCPMLSCSQIMLFRNNVCKVPILGLKRINDNTDLYRFGGDTLLPVRWMAPEAIDHHINTKKTDVWTFAIVLYEILTLGDIPYKDIDQEDLPRLLSIGHRLGKPASCGDRLFAIMESCWQQEPRDRPSFGEIVEELRALKHDDNAICFGEDYIEHPTSSRNPFNNH